MRWGIGVSRSEVGAFLKRGGLDYVIPQGLSLLHLDRAADLGTYLEPNIWMRHS